jgi:ribosomal protein L19E
MSDIFDSARFGKKVWLTNHAIESMAKRKVTLAEIKRLIEEGQYRAKEASHGWIFHRCIAPAYAETYA